MRKLVRTVIINDEDEDEDEDEVNMHHRHHHVSIALGPGGVSRGCWGGSGPIPARAGGGSASRSIGVAACRERPCWKSPPTPSDLDLLRTGWGAVREAQLVPRVAWRWEVDGRRFSTAAAPSSPLREAAGTNPEVTWSFVSARRSPRGAEICTRSSSGQRAGSVPGAELPPLLPLSTRTSLAAAQEPPAACPHEERPCAEGGIAAGLRLGTVGNGDAAAGAAWQRQDGAPAPPARSLGRSGCR